MARLLFIYPIHNASSQSFRYAETARRLFNEKVDVRLLTIGEDIPIPSILGGIPHVHISASMLKGSKSLSVQLQSRIWQYLLAIPKDGLSIFMNGLDFPLVFWACKKLDLPLIAQVPEGKSYPIFHRQIIRWMGKSGKTTLLYGSQAHANNHNIRGFKQHTICMPLSNQCLQAARQHREMAQPKGDAWFSVIIACRKASRDTLKKIALIADRCESLKFQCWFFRKEDLPRGKAVLDSKANVSCLRPKESIPLYRTAKLYMEVEEVKGKATWGLQMHYIREAMAFGLPALLSENGLGKEWITPGVNGYLVESSQVVEIANKIQLLAHSDLLYDRLSNNAAKIAQKWHPPNVCKALSDLLLTSKRKCNYRRGLRQSEHLTT
ncbi:MAG: glycosyltransferase [Saprospiraceae bacterium]|nr:glycosyltransferase [Saprospiraceae bacterium]